MALWPGVVLAFMGLIAVAHAEDDRSAARLKMVEDIERLHASAGEEAGLRSLDPRVLEAMRSVPREEFVPEEEKERPTATGRCPSAKGRRSPSPISWR